MTDTEINDAELLAAAGDGLIAQTLFQALAEIRTLRHALADPNYLYAGARIHRQALVTRSEQIERLRDELAEFRKQKAAAD